MALGSGLRLVGTASARRWKRAKNGGKRAKMGEMRPKKCEPRELTKDQLAPAKQLCGDGADFEVADSAGNTPMQHHRRNGENGDAVLVGGFLEECENPDPIFPAIESLRS